MSVSRDLTSVSGDELGSTHWVAGTEGAQQGVRAE